MPSYCRLSHACYGQPLSCALLTRWLKDIFAASGIQGSFSCHSFRIGAAVVATRAGIPDHLIQAMGRWNSDAYKLYIRTPVEALAPCCHNDYGFW